MEKTMMSSRKSHRARPKAVVVVLATVALAGGVLFPAAAPPSASARASDSLVCAIADQIQQLRNINNLGKDYRLNRVLRSCGML
jgi:hypothetical protein